MKVLLINPPVNRLCNVAQNYFPLGLGYLASVCKKRGFEVKIYNAELETRPSSAGTNRDRIEGHRLYVEALVSDSHPVWQECRTVLAKCQPRVVGISVTSGTIGSALKIASLAKEVCGATVVFGGMHPTILPEETARAAHVDYIISGEAEESFPALLDSLNQRRDVLSVPGTGAMVDGSFRFNPALAPQRDLRAFPVPDRDALLDLERDRPWLNALITSRGCPHHCTFCSGRKITGGVVRHRPVEDVLAEIRLLKDKYGMTFVAFYDDAFVLNKKRVAMICQEMIKARLGVIWTAFTRADSVDKELLLLMRESGCRYLGVGVESGSDRTLRLIKKGYTRDQAVTGVTLIKEAGIAPSINIIIGFPFEEEADIRESINLIEELKVPTNVNTFTPYPGSELYEECRRRGLVVDGATDWAKLSQHSPFNRFVVKVSPSRYRELLDEMVETADAVSAQAEQERIISISLLTRVARKLQSAWRDAQKEKR